MFRSSCGRVSSCVCRLAVKKSFAVESKDAVMDVNADDADGMRRKKAQVTWYAPESYPCL